MGLQNEWGSCGWCKPLGRSQQTWDKKNQQNFHVDRDSSIGPGSVVAFLSPRNEIDCQWLDTVQEGYVRQSTQKSIRPFRSGENSGKMRCACRGPFYKNRICWMKKILHHFNFSLVQIHNWRGFSCQTKTVKTHQPNLGLLRSICRNPVVAESAHLSDKKDRLSEPVIKLISFERSQSEQFFFHPRTSRAGASLLSFRHSLPICR